MTHDPATYAAGPLAQVPGFADLHRMALVLLDEAAPPDARILVLGAGGGLELAAFAQARPGWSFLGIDPSAPMLDQARRTLGPLAARADLHHGLIHDAPRTPCHGATAFLTFHFIAQADRVPTLAALHARLLPGARLVLAHLSLPEGQEDQWLARYAAYSALNGIDADRARQGAARIRSTLPVLSPGIDAALITEAGFADIQPFYQGLAFRGWVATAQATTQVTV